jgi:Glycosyl hydrolases family 39
MMKRAARFSRRTALQLPLSAAAVRKTRAGADEARGVIVSVSERGCVARRFARQDFGTVGVFDIDWLVQPRFTRLLDNFAASPGAFHGVRCFGSFTAGQLESYLPSSGGRVWLSPDGSPDFSAPFRSLQALVERGLTPFLALGFFPPAVSRSPIAPPQSWEHWKTLVRAFFTELAADPRFGPAIETWRFEVWNEPNEGRFWSGTVDDYLALYRATSQAIDEAGVSISLGGPAIAYKPEAIPADGPPWMDRFLRSVVADPTLRLDFISLHRKGTVGDDPPDPRHLFAAAEATARQALAIDAQRFSGVTIINDEADEKVGFEVPYAPRMDQRNAAWLAASLVIHETLNGQFRENALRFAAAADNADLQLVQAPFDGRRSIMTIAQPAATTDLLKIPAYGFYELLRVLVGHPAAVISGSERLFPATDLYHVATASDDSVAALLTCHPDPNASTQTTRPVDYSLTDIPWQRVNIARFQIDQRRSNAYAAAGGSEADPFPMPARARIPEIRNAQEITLARPIARNLTVTEGVYREQLEIEPFTTLCLWITPDRPDPPAEPHWLEASREADRVILRWTPNHEPFFYGYEVFLLRDGVPKERITPEPLRAALWIDTHPSTGRRIYGVRAVTASGVMSPLVLSPDVWIEGRVG